MLCTGGPRCCCLSGRHSSVPRSVSRVTVGESAFVGPCSTRSHSSGGTSHASRASFARVSHPCMHTSLPVAFGLRVLHAAYAAWPAQPCTLYSSLIVCRIRRVTCLFSSPEVSAFMHVVTPASSSVASVVNAIRKRSTIARLYGAAGSILSQVFVTSCSRCGAFPFGVLSAWITLRKAVAAFSEIVASASVMMAHTCSQSSQAVSSALPFFSVSVILGDGVWGSFAVRGPRSASLFLGPLRSSAAVLSLSAPSIVFL